MFTDFFSFTQFFARLKAKVTLHFKDMNSMSGNLVEHIHNAMLWAHVCALGIGNVCVCVCVCGVGLVGGTAAFKLQKKKW